MSTNEENTPIENRREIIFLYDVIRSNPNGDPDDGNRPRMDENGYNIVTDVRLKRTIRDYWISQKDSERSVLIKQQYMDDDKTVMSMRDIVAKELQIDENITRKDIIDQLPKKFLDVRSFGAAVTLPGANVSITGPVQFGIGISLNKPELISLTITTVMSSTGEQGAGSMGQTHILDYSLISFHGIVCETNCEKLNFTAKDLKAIYDGLWDGTKKLNTRSKFNHQPHLILAIVSKEKEFQIGGLDTKLRLEKEEGIKQVDQVVILIDDFMETLLEHQDKILKIEYKESKELQYMYQGTQRTSIEEIFAGTGINLETI